MWSSLVWSWRNLCFCSVCLVGRWWFDKWYERRLRLKVARPMIGVGWSVLDNIAV